MNFVLALPLLPSLSSSSTLLIPLERLSSLLPRVVLASWSRQDRGRRLEQKNTAMEWYPLAARDAVADRTSWSLVS